LAASIRFGAISLAAMLPDTSNASRTVPSSRGTPMTLCGRASESTRIETPTTVKIAGSRRRQVALGRVGGVVDRVAPDAAPAVWADPVAERLIQPNWAARSARTRSRRR
jgi:hypothetical protein